MWIKDARWHCWPWPGNSVPRTRSTRNVGSLSISPRRDWRAPLPATPWSMSTFGIQGVGLPSPSPGIPKLIAMIPLRPPFTGTCAEAIFRGNPVISNDILEDMRFNLQRRTLCLGAGLKSLHSLPIAREVSRHEGASFFRLLSSGVCPRICVLSSALRLRHLQWRSRRYCDLPPVPQ